MSIPKRIIQAMHKHAAQLRVIDELSDSLDEKGFTLTVVGNEIEHRLGAKLVGPDGRVYLYDSDDLSLRKLSQWATYIKDTSP